MIYAFVCMELYPNMDKKYPTMAKKSLFRNHMKSGCVLLIQLWSWERITFGRPQTVIGYNQEGSFEQLTGS